MIKWIANWGNFPRIRSNEQAFSLASQLDTLVAAPESFIARGNGRCYGDASLESTTLSTLLFDKVLAFDTTTGIFECQSGLTLDAILEIVVPKGWFLPVTPGTKFITVGGAVASDVHGKNHHREGSFSAHVLELELMLADGKSVICSPQEQEELFWATCGGMGLTGVITRVRFQLKKIETSYIKQKQVKAANLEEVLALFEKYREYTYSVAWIDCLQQGKAFGRSILILGEHAAPGDLNDKQRKDPLALPRKKKIPLPFYLPSFALNRFTIRLFNALYYAKNTRKEINNVTSYEPFFYPLDTVLNWNKGYGKKGFVQYQFVLPMDQKQGLVEILKRISAQGTGSFLAVLKVFGVQDDLISFPKEGYTLALDFPVRDGLFPFLDELDELVLRYGGRIYLSKDARMKPSVFWDGYPNAERFAGLVRKFNPLFKINSLQARRLRITE